MCELRATIVSLLARWCPQDLGDLGPQRGAVRFAVEVLRYAVAIAVAAHHEQQFAPNPGSANAVEPIQGRIHIEKINEPFLFRDRGSPAEYGAGLKLAIERGWLKMHESGTFVTFTSAGAELFA